jgi:diphthamide synthase (EF-2-diphthine--ammonia ligase)
MYPTVFGDLHLDHVRHWRDTELGKLGIALEYPLWKVPYASLIKDFEESNVEYVLSASTRDGIEVGSVFGRDFSDRIERDSLDGFGENGERRFKKRRHVIG